MGDEQPSLGALLGNVSLHFPLTPFLLIACQSSFPCPRHHTSVVLAAQTSAKQLAVFGTVHLSMMCSTAVLLHIVLNATSAVQYIDCNFNTEATVQTMLES